MPALPPLVFSPPVGVVGAGVGVGVGVEVLSVGVDGLSGVVSFGVTGVVSGVGVGAVSVGVVGFVG